MLDGLLQTFTGSKQGQAAMQQLGAQGFAPAQTSGIIGAALPAAAQAMQSAMSGGGVAAPSDGPAPMGITDIGQSNYVMNFMGAAVAGLIRGEGFKGAAIDGLQGVVGGHVAQVIATRCGLPKRTAGLVGAVLTPLLIDFLWDKFKGKPKEEPPPQPQAPPPQMQAASGSMGEIERMREQMHQMQMQQMQMQMQQMQAQMQQQQMRPPGGYGYGYAQPPPMPAAPPPMYDPASHNPYTGVEFHPPPSQNFYSAYRR